MHSLCTPTHNINFNGDFSGNVTFWNGVDPEIELPFDTIKQVVAEWARRKRISRLELMDDDELLIGES